MGVKEDLAAVRRSKLRLEALMEQRRWLMEVGSCHSGGGTAALAQLQRELDRAIDEVAQRQLAAKRRIDALDDPGQRDVLYYRYLNGWAWKEIAARMKLSTDWVKHVHARAIRALET